MGEHLKAVSEGWHALTLEEQEGQSLDDNTGTREAWEALRSETQAQDRHCPHARHADVPYRGILSRILRRADSDQEALGLIHSFFENITDWSRK